MRHQSQLFFFVSARKLSLVGDLPGANVKSYAGYLTVNKKYNSNLFFWFFPALMVGSYFLFSFRGFPNNNSINVTAAVWV